MERTNIVRLRKATQCAEYAIDLKARTGKHPAAWDFAVTTKDTIGVSAQNAGEPPIGQIARVLNEHQVEIADWVREATAQQEKVARAALDQCLKEVKADEPT